MTAAMALQRSLFQPPLSPHLLFFLLQPQSNTRKMQSYTAPKQVLDDVPMEEVGGGGDTDPFAGRGPQRVADRETDYQRRRLARALSPSRADAFATTKEDKAKGKGKKKEGDEEPSSYADVMKAAALARERDNTLANIRAKERAKEAGEAAAAAAAAAVAGSAAADGDEEKPSKKAKTSEWDEDEGRGAATTTAPRGSLPAGAPSAWDATPVAPSASAAAAAAAAAAPRRPRSRWDETPVGVLPGGAAPSAAAAAANFFGATPVVGGASFGATPVIHSSSSAVPPPSASSMTAEQFHALKVEQDLGGRNRPWTSEELDSLLPGAR